MSKEKKGILLTDEVVDYLESAGKLDLVFETDKEVYHAYLVKDYEKPIIKREGGCWSIIVKKKDEA